MLDNQKNRYLNLVKELAISDFKLRYQGSLLGYLWSFIKPLLLFGILYLVFSVFLRFQIEHYNLYLLLGIILWTYVVDGTNGAINDLLAKSGFISRVTFPRTIIIISSTLTNFFTLILNLLVFSIFFIVSDVPFSPLIFLFILFLVELYLVVLGVGYLLSALNIKFRDLSHIWTILLQLGFWATPIVYTLNMVPVKYHFWIFLNPVARIIQYSRQVVINNTLPDLKGILGSVLLTIAIYVVGYLVYKKREPYFAEDI